MWEPSDRSPSLLAAEHEDAVHEDAVHEDGGGDVAVGPIWLSVLPPCVLFMITDTLSGAPVVANFNQRRVPCGAMPCGAMWCHVVPCHVMQCHAM